MKQHTAIINERGVIIRYSHLLFETAFINTFKVKYPASIQTTIAVNKALLKMVIIPALSNTIIIAPWDGTYLWTSQKTCEVWTDGKIFQIEILDDQIIL